MMHIIISVVKTFCFNNQVKRLGQTPGMIPMPVGKHHSLHLFRYLIISSNYLVMSSEFTNINLGTQILSNLTELCTQSLPIIGHAKVDWSYDTNVVMVIMNKNIAKLPCNHNLELFIWSWSCCWYWSVSVFKVALSFVTKI